MQRDREIGLVRHLDLVPVGLELLVVGVLLDFGQSGDIRQPAVADPGADQFDQSWIRQPDEASRRDAIGDIAELLRPHLGEIPERALLEQAGLQWRNTVYRIAANRGQVRHAHMWLPVVADDAHAFDTRLIARPNPAHVFHEAPVDFVDDLHMTGQETPEDLHRPGLERLWQERVAGVSEHLRRDIPRHRPRNVAFIHQVAHHLRHRDRRVCVVQLEDITLVEIAQIVSRRQEAEDVLDRAGDKEILLSQPEFFPLRGSVVRVKHLRDRFRRDLLLHRVDIVARIEGAQVELLRGSRSPEPERVHHLGVISGHQNVVGNADHLLARNPAHLELAGFVVVRLGMAAETNPVRKLRVDHLPRRGAHAPTIRLFDLPAIDEGLPKDAKVISNTVADRGNIQRRE